MYKIMTDVFWKSCLELKRYKEIDLVPERSRAVSHSPVIVDLVSASELADSICSRTLTLSAYTDGSSGGDDLCYSLHCVLKNTKTPYTQDLQLLDSDFADDCHRSNFLRLNKIPVIFKLSVFSYL